MRVLLLLLLLACNSKREPPPIVVQPPVVVPTPEPLPPTPEPELPTPTVNRACLPGTSDTMARRWIREVIAGGWRHTTYWYDSAGSYTGEGLPPPHGCLSGFGVNQPFSRENP